MAGDWKISGTPQAESGQMSSPDLNFTIQSAEPLPFAAGPHIVFKLHVTNSSPRHIHTVILKCQIQLEVSRRSYTADEQARLQDLFGEPERWGETLRSLLWTNTSVIIPAFDQSITTDLQVPCTFDFNVAAAKYFAGLDDDTVPVTCYFSGTIFYENETGGLQAVQISWEKEAGYRMPVRIWRQMMDAYYPNAVWICLRRDAFERLYAYKTRHGIPTFDEAVLRVFEEKSQTGAV